jgi:glycosyltransferase A (GT-A) superfamily protein (DUF2064 family)
VESGAKASRRWPAIILFAKSAQIGDSRLARRIGEPDAALVNHRVLSRVLRHLRQGGIPVSVAIGGDTPDYVDMAERAGAGVVLRPHGDLGRQLARFLRQRKNGAILLDSDAPNLDAVLVRHAASALGRFDIVIGPNWSGGTYLIGVRSPYHTYKLFRGVRWGGRHMLEDLLKRIPKEWAVGLLPVLADTSDPAGLAEAAEDHTPSRRRSSSLGLIKMKRK